MDWKSFYRAEITSAVGESAARAALARWPAGDPEVTQTLRGGGVISFPHVTLRDSAEPIARVVQSILGIGAPRVVALGVLHGGTLPAPWRDDLAAFQRGGPDADAAFARLRGVFVDSTTARTPLGDVPVGPSPALGDAIREDLAPLENEFSLDLFLALLAAAARDRGVAAPQVTRVFVSLVRDARGSFATADAVADAVRGLLGDGIVCVATGDLVHFGHSYTPPEEMAGLPSDAAALEAHFLPRVREMLAAGLAAGGDEAGYAAASRLRSDQRNVLPVIARLLGPSAAAGVLSFRLSDYAAINGVASPCLVASALVAFRPRAR